jgi:hypothetical protein
MSVYIVFFDLHSRYARYDAFYSLLTEFDHIKVFENVWYIDSELDARQIYGSLSEELHSSDKIVVHAVEKDFAGYIPGRANGWIDSRLDSPAKPKVRTIKKHVRKKEASLLHEAHFKPKD